MPAPYKAMNATHIYIGKRTSGHEANINGEEGVCVSFTLELQGSGWVLGVNSVDRPDKGVSLGSPVAFSSH